MMDFSNYNIGLGITGSFCTFAKARKEIQRLCDMGANVVPVFSFNAQTCDTRFGSAKDYVDGICEITGNEGSRSDRIIFWTSWSLRPAPEIRRQNSATESRIHRC